MEGRAAEGAPYQLLVDATTSSDQGPFLERQFAPQTARFIRLTVTGIADASTDWISILEFRVLAGK
jgi:hypothetical protein